MEEASSRLKKKKRGKKETRSRRFHRRITALFLCLRGVYKKKPTLRTPRSKKKKRERKKVEPFVEQFVKNALANAVQRWVAVQRLSWVKKHGDHA